MTTKTRRYRILSTEGLAPGESPGVINDNIEAVEWRDDLDRPHRVGSPAIKYLNGSYGYYINGAPHREDGPALKNKNGCFYYVNGLIHNDSGPAVILERGQEYFALNGIYLEPEEWLNALPEEARVKYLFDLNHKTL